MSPQEVRELAQHHEERGATALKLANVMLGKAQENFQREAAKHIGWAEDLRELANEMETP